MIDNLFIVQSPLQALIAVELSLQFSGKTNGIIYRLSGESRKRNDEQILRVIEMGQWSFIEQVQLSKETGVRWHLKFRRYILNLNKRFEKKVKNLFIGEFRDHWMHLVRINIAPEKYILIDDGAATLTVKRRYIDKQIYYPDDIWHSNNFIKNLAKRLIYIGIVDKTEIKKPLVYASAFLKSESEFNIDFSWSRLRLKGAQSLKIDQVQKAYFFGSKYSEAGILSLDYELNFISDVVRYYRNKGLDLVYCAHRDESDEKLNLIRRLGQVEVIAPKLPAELFILESHGQVAEIAAAYSSVLNNLRLIVPDKPIVSFRLSDEEINSKNKEDIKNIYDYLERSGIIVYTANSIS